MSERHVATYLSDHLAGSELALELLEHFERAHAGTPEAAFAAGLREEIAADRKELEAVMDRLNVSRSTPRRAVAWVAEKMTELKLRVDDLSSGAFRRLEVFEAVSLGIEGKRLLWRSLAELAQSKPELGGTDYDRLIRRAEDQRARVEPFRLAAARDAMGV